MRQRHKQAGLKNEQPLALSKGLWEWAWRATSPVLWQDSGCGAESGILPPPPQDTSWNSLCLHFLACISLSSAGMPWLPGRTLQFCLKAASSAPPSSLPYSSPDAGDLQSLTMHAAFASSNFMRNVRSFSSLASKYKSTAGMGHGAQAAWS